jgi:6-phosphogluconolactonase
MIDLRVVDEPGQLGARAAELVEDRALSALRERGTFTVAVSGGSTPAAMFDALAERSLPWTAVHLFQVDERVAPAGHPDRNLTHVRENLLGSVELPPGNLHPMRVEDEDLRRAASLYQRELEAVTGAPAVLDAVHLGLGADGHTASLVPGDAVLAVDGADVAITGTYAGHVRITLTYPLIDRARALLWVVTGAEKAPVLPRLLGGDRSIPAGRVRPAHAVVLADRAAAANLSPDP